MQGRVCDPTILSAPCVVTATYKGTYYIDQTDTRLGFYDKFSYSYSGLAGWDFLDWYYQQDVLHRDHRFSPPREETGTTSVKKWKDIPDSRSDAYLKHPYHEKILSGGDVLEEWIVVAERVWPVFRLDATKQLACSSENGNALVCDAETGALLYHGESIPNTYYDL